MKKHQWKILLAVIILVGMAAFIFFKAGFPLSTSFGQIFASQKIEKIVVIDGNTGKSRQTTDAMQINRFLDNLSKEKLRRHCNISGKSGWTYCVKFYLKGQSGYYEYLTTSYFKKRNGFSASLPAGNCIEENTEEVYKIIHNFYMSIG